MMWLLHKHAGMSLGKKKISDTFFGMHNLSQLGVWGRCKGPFKCYVTLEGVGGCMPKRYEALRGGGGGVTSTLRNVIFFS